MKSGWPQIWNRSTPQHKTLLMLLPTIMHWQYLHHKLMCGKFHYLTLLSPINIHQSLSPPTLCHHSHTPPISYTGLPLTTTRNQPTTHCPPNSFLHRHQKQIALPPLFQRTHNSLTSHLAVSHPDPSHPHRYLYNQLLFRLMLYKV